MAGGSVTVLQPDPEFPAEATVMMPAASWLLTAVCRVSHEQPSDVGQPQELLVTSGALAGSGLDPSTFVGARKN